MPIFLYSISYIINYAIMFTGNNTSVAIAKLCYNLQVNSISVLLCTLTNQISIPTFSQ